MRFLYFTVSSSVLIGLVLMIRRLFKRQLSPVVIYALWLIPAVRLLLPFGYVELPGLSAPYEWFQQGVMYIADGEWRTETAPADWSEPEEAAAPGAGTEVPVVEAVTPHGEYEPALQTTVPSEKFVPDTARKSSEGTFTGRLSRLEQTCLLLWLCGSVVVGSYALISNCRLRRTVRHMDMNRGDSPLPICLSNAVVAPCLFGLFRPRILLSWKVKGNPELYHQVLRHELAHYRQKDHVWTVVRIWLCVVYWWNPMVWLGAVRSREDAELACDQRVIRNLDTKGRREYGLALLLLLQQTWNQPTILYSATSMHGQGKSLKRRIESIAETSRTRIWILMPVLLIMTASLLLGCSMLSDESWVSMDWVYAEGSRETGWNASTECKYDLKEEITSKLFYYEIYSYGVLTERHVLTYGDLGADRRKTQSIVLERTEDDQVSEYGHYLVLEENDTETRIKLQLPFDVRPWNGGAAILETDGKLKVHAGDDLILLAEYAAEKAEDGEEPEETEPVHTCESLTGKSEEELAAILADNDQTVLIRMVLSGLPEQELAAQYEALEYPAAAGEDAGDSTQNSEELRESELLANRWAEAFCGRDGETILNLASEEVSRKLQDEMLMDVMSDGTVSFGWSSPWPGMFTDEGYRLLSVDKYGAEILYYAGVSDPHLTVWRELLTFGRVDDELLVTGFDLRELGDISTSEEFFMAYPGGEITGTVMDYAANGLGEYLNDHAMEQTDMEIYQLLKDPELAVCSLLNLGRPWNEDTEGEPRQVEISLEETDDRTIARITFPADESTVEVQMVQPYGADGIWIPETATVPWTAEKMTSTLSAAGAVGAEAAAGEETLEGSAAASFDGSGWYPTELTYVTPGWAKTYQSGLPKEDVRETGAQKALKELCDLTGYQVESCVYTCTGNGGYLFARNESDMEHSRIFYDRYFEDESTENSIPSMDLSNARRIWYSDVEQLVVPERADQMTKEELAVWFLQRSSLYRGQEIAGTGKVFEADPDMIKVTMADGTFYEVQVDQEICAVDSIYGPYPEGAGH